MFIPICFTCGGGRREPALCAGSVLRGLPTVRCPFAAVTVAAEPASASPAPAPGLIEIEFACGARLRISGAVEPATAAAVVAAVTGGRR